MELKRFFLCKMRELKRLVKYIYIIKIIVLLFNDNKIVISIYIRFF